MDPARVAEAAAGVAIAVARLVATDRPCAYDCMGRMASMRTLAASTVRLAPSGTPLSPAAVESAVRI